MQKTYWPTIDWIREEPANLGMIPNKLSQLDVIIQSEYSNISGIIVVRNFIEEAYLYSKEKFEKRKK